ncbi:hypothetical protein GCM10007978_00270 [Shewanella hanedai]|uniref:Lipoprotein n=1 Tax=Shewanella hanedai TaxID=25 RepID=A0A553JUL7_SHEHA|nr:hypothetical protein [Shewanella hanedai]TRY16145.1 hypothetical protein FN961_00495 [Shewanella hanedai]GGI66949.1 hypothetical protein GCM10007978_00270 [Shewanella hanedai]
MRILITISLFVLSLTGCADRALTQMGSEAIVYQELHHFVIEPKKAGDKAEIEAQLDRIIDRFTHGLEQTLWTLSYRTEIDKSWVTLTKRKLLSLGLSPDRVSVEPLPLGHSVIDIRVGQYKLKTQECQRGIYGKMGSDIGCYVDSMRLKQVRDPQTLTVKGGV